MASKDSQRLIRKVNSRMLGELIGVVGTFAVGVDTKNDGLNDLKTDRNPSMLFPIARHGS